MHAVPPDAVPARTIGKLTFVGAVTELTAGSGLYGPTLFDAYRAWRPSPAAYFALPPQYRKALRRRRGKADSNETRRAAANGYLADDPEP